VDTVENGYYPVAAVFLFLLFLIGIARTKIGYTLLYYFVLASILIVVLLGSPTIVKIFGSNKDPIKGKS
jgi:hypothetical protein